MILCPYGVATALINHSKEKANAKLVWSEKTTRRPEWLRQHPSQWIHELKAGLAFDVVALRDIQRYVQSSFDEIFVEFFMVIRFEHLAAFEA